MPAEDDTTADVAREDERPRTDVEWWVTSDIGWLAHAWDRNSRGLTACGLQIRRSGFPAGARREQCQACIARVDNGRSAH